MLPTTLSITVNPNWIEYCNAAEEESCLVTFGVWKWAYDNEIHLTHVATNIDGSLSFTHEDARYVWPARADIEEIVTQFDSGERTKPAIIKFRVRDAAVKVKPVVDPFKRAQRTDTQKKNTIVKKFLINKTRRTYLPISEDTPVRKNATTFSGTTAEMQANYPKFALDPDSKDKGQLSARRQRFNQAMGHAKDAKVKRS